MIFLQSTGSICIIEFYFEVNIRMKNVEKLRAEMLAKRCSFKTATLESLLLSSAAKILR